MPRVRVQAEPFDLAAEFAALAAGGTGIGGTGCFIGTVRDSAHGRPIEALELEHYPGMTERAIAAIAAEAEQLWALLGCTVVHRIGRLLPGDAIVLVLAAAGHRQPALEATSFLIDWLKTRAPFWKKEHFTDGTRAWVAARAEDEQAAQRWRQLAARGENLSRF